MATQTCRTGCRYWPRMKGPFFFAGGFAHWEAKLWDRGEVRDELSHIADIGFDFVRIMLPWNALQPTASHLRTPLLNRLAALLDTIEEVGLTLQLTIVGQLAGTLFVPYWLLASQPEMARHGLSQRVIAEDWISPWPLGDLYEENSLLAGQRLLWHELTRHFATHPALTELDLSAGGLLSLLTPRNPEIAVNWWQMLAEQTGDDSLSLLYSDSPALLMQPTARFPYLHEWHDTVGQLAMATTVRDSGTKKAADEKWPLFQMQLAYTLAHAPVGCISLALPTAPANRSHRLEEEQDPANPHPPLFYTEEQQAYFFHRTLPALYDIGVPFICHSTWADVPPTGYSMPPYDENTPLRHAGLLREDGREKEVTSIWRTFHFHAEKASKATPASIRRLDIDQDEWYQRRHEPDFVTTLYKQYQHGEI